MLYGFATNDDKAALERHEKTKKNDDDGKPFMAADAALFAVAPVRSLQAFSAPIFLAMIR